MQHISPTAHLVVGQEKCGDKVWIGEGRDKAGLGCGSHQSREVATLADIVDGGGVLVARRKLSGTRCGGGAKPGSD